MENGLRLVSFDGGGQKSLSQLKIMENIMHRMQCILYPDDPDKILLPCQCFDLMGGSDTGGLIAAMFSKMRMSANEATEEFHRICSEVYAGSLSPKARTSKLRKSLEDLLTRRGLPVDLKLGSDMRLDSDECPFFVISKLKNNVQNKIRLCSYRSEVEPSPDITLVDALLATCATESGFLPVSIGSPTGEQELIGAVMGAANPSKELIYEAYNKFKGDAIVATILSLGNGHLGTLAAPGLGQSHKWTAIYRELASDCEQVAHDLEIQMGHLGIFFRFCVDQGLQWNHGANINDRGWMTTQTYVYLQHIQVSQKMDSCVESLRLRQGLSTLERLKYRGSQPIYKGLPPLVPYFVMRREPWSKMGARLDHDGTQAEQTILVISGMAGCGKTQLLIRFVHEFRSRFRHVFFIDASSKERIQAELVNHIRAADPAYSQTTLPETISFFCDPRHSPWLIAYDNCSNIDLDLESLLPNCNQGSIVLTTRNRSRGQFATRPDLHLELEVMTDEEAIEVITRSARLDDSETDRLAAGEIASELGNLPMALVQAGSYIFQTSCTCADYLSRLRKYKSEMMDIPASDREHRSAYAVFDLSYQSLPTQVQNFLHIMGCVHFTTFPVASIPIAAISQFRSQPRDFEEYGPEYTSSIEILMSTFCPQGTWDDRTLDNIVLTLQNYYLANFTRSTTTLLLRMHPLLHEWVLSRLSSEDKTLFHGAASRLIACASVEDRFHQYLIPHIDILRSQSSISIPMNDRAAFGKVFQGMQRYDDARIIWDDIYANLTNVHGYLNLQVAVAATQLAAAIKHDFQQREYLEKNAVEIRRTLLGPDHLETLHAQVELARTYSHQIRWDESENLFTDILAKLEAKLGNSHYETLAVMFQLAKVYNLRGQYDKAERLQEHVLEVWEEQLGDTHLDTLQAKQSLGWTYRLQGRHAEALQLQNHVLTTRKQQLGDNHPDTLWAIHNLAITYYHLRRHDDAQELQELVFKMRMEMLGDTHPHTLVAMGNLASTYHELGRYSDAVQLEDKVLKKQRKRFGDHHTKTALSMHRLARTYHKLGRHTQALALVMEAERVRKKSLGIDHPDYKSTLQLLRQIHPSEDQHLPDTTVAVDSTGLPTNTALPSWRSYSRFPASVRWQ